MPRGDVFRCDLGEKLIGLGVDPVRLALQLMGAQISEGEVDESVDRLTVPVKLRPTRQLPPTGHCTN